MSISTSADRAERMELLRLASQMTNSPDGVLATAGRLYSFVHGWTESAWRVDNPYEVERNAGADGAHPQPVKIAEGEGGDWITWAEWRREKSPPTSPYPGGKRLHTIVFDNGWEFDALNGWRSPDRE